MQLKWPWVPREMYETADKAFSEMCAAFNRQSDVVDQLRADIREQRDYNRTLVQTIVDMRREGFGKAPEAPAMPKRERDSVEEAINAIAGSNIRERSRLGRYVSLMRTRGRDDDAICHELMNPQPDEDGVSA